MERDDRLAAALYVDQVCNRFELAWRAGRCPPIEEWVVEGREALLRELLALELDLRSERGEAPSAVEYYERFPNEIALIDDAFAEIGSAAGESQLQDPVRPHGQAIPETASEASGLAPGTKVLYFGDYEILEELGEGAMGTVYRARQRTLKREVALKTIRLSGLGRASEIRRFLFEAEAAARLNHPNIVPIYEIGDHKGQPYFSMELLKGHSLKDKLTDGRIERRKAAELMQKIAEAVQFAHGHGVIHRDLKPSNVLLTTEGVPKVADFGLAKRTDTDSGLSVSGMVLGTPGYMAPEQAEGRVQDVSVAADIYGLGATLYELLTDRPPFRAVSVEETLRQVIKAEPARPRALDPSIPRDLETICLKCLEKEPPRRYRSAKALAEELGRWLRDEPIRARAVGPAERTLKWARRRPAIAALTVAISLVTLFGAALVTWKWRAAVDALRLSRLHAYIAHINLAQRGWRDNHLDRARELLDDAAESDLRGFEWHYLHERLYPELLALKGHANYVMSVAFSPDGQRIASASWDQTVKLWDARSGRGLMTLAGHTGGITAVSFSPDGRRIASASVDRTVRLWDAVTGRELMTLNRHMGEVRSVVFSPDGRRIASASDDETVRLWDASNGRELVTIKGGHTANINAVVFSPDGQRIASASASWDQTVKLWDARSGRGLMTLAGHTGGITAVSFSPDGRRIASASVDRTVRLWDAVTGRELMTLNRHTDEVRSVVFSPDGRRIASASDDETVRLWDASNGRELVTIKGGHTANINAVVFSPDGQRIASASDDKTIRLWDPMRRQDFLVLDRSYSTDSSCKAAFSPDGRRIASAVWGGATDTQVWDAASGQELLTLKGHKDPVSSVAFSPDGRRIASASDDGTVRLWDAYTGQAMLTLEYAVERSHVVNGPRQCVAFGCDGRRIAFASKDRKARVWDAANGELLMVLSAHTAAVTSVAFSPDGQRIATASWDRTLKLWDANNGQELMTLTGHTSGITTVCFSPDGRRIASASNDATVRLWDVVTGREVMVLKGHIYLDTEFFAHSINAVVFSPDGRRIASASNDGMVKVWEASTGQELLTIKMPDSASSCRLSFSPDGHRLFAIGPKEVDASFENEILSMPVEFFVSDTRAAERLLLIAEGVGISLGILKPLLFVPIVWRWETTATRTNLAIWSWGTRPQTAQPDR